MSFQLKPLASLSVHWFLLYDGALFAPYEAPYICRQQLVLIAARVFLQLLLLGLPRYKNRATSRRSLNAFSKGCKDNISINEIERYPMRDDDKKKTIKADSRSGSTAGMSKERRWLMNPKLDRRREKLSFVHLSFGSQKSSSFPLTVRQTARRCLFPVERSVTIIPGTVSSTDVLEHDLLYWAVSTVRI